MKLYDSLRHHLVTQDCFILYVLAMGGYGKTSSLLQLYQDHSERFGKTLYICPSSSMVTQLRDINPFLGRFSSFSMMNVKKAVSYLIMNYYQLDSIIIDNVSLSNTYYNTILRIGMSCQEFAKKRIFLLSSVSEMKLYSYFPSMILLNYSTKHPYPISYHYLTEDRLYDPSSQIQQQLEFVVNMCSTILFHRTIIFVANPNQCYLVLRHLKRCLPHLSSILWCGHLRTSRSHFQRIRDKLSDVREPILLITTHEITIRIILFRKIDYVFDFGIHERNSGFQSFVTKIDWCDRFQIEVRAMCTGRDSAGIVFRLFPKSFLSVTSYIIPPRRLIQSHWIDPLLLLHHHGYKEIINVLGWESYSVWKRLKQLGMLEDSFLVEAYFETQLSIDHCLLLKRVLSISNVECAFMVLISIALMETIESLNITICPPWGNRSKLHSLWKSVFLYPHQENNELHLYISMMIVYLRVPEVQRFSFLRMFHWYPYFLYRFLKTWKRCMTFMKSFIPDLVHWKQWIDYRLPWIQEETYSIRILHWTHPWISQLSSFFCSLPDTHVQIYPISRIYQEQLPPWFRTPLEEFPHELICIPQSFHPHFYRLCVWITPNPQSSRALFTYPYHLQENWISDLKRHLSQLVTEQCQKQYWKSYFTNHCLVSIREKVFYYPSKDGFSCLLSRWWESQQTLLQEMKTTTNFFL